jgi:hypothetical protein
MLPEPERDWRRIAGFIVSSFNREHLAARSQDFNYVSYPQYTPYLDYTHYRAGNYEGDVDDQGNGQGSST